MAGSGFTEDHHGCLTAFISKMFSGHSTDSVITSTNNSIGGATLVGFPITANSNVITRGIPRGSWKPGFTEFVTPGLWTHENFEVVAKKVVFINPVFINERVFFDLCTEVTTNSTVHSSNTPSCGNHTPVRTNAKASHTESPGDFCEIYIIVVEVNNRWSCFQVAILVGPFKTFMAFHCSQYKFLKHCRRSHWLDL